MAKEKIKAIVMEAVIEFLNEINRVQVKPRELDVKGMEVQSGFDVPIKVNDKKMPKMPKPDSNKSVTNSLNEEFIKNLKKSLRK